MLSGDGKAGHEKRLASACCTLFLSYVNHLTVHIQCASAAVATQAKEGKKLLFIMVH